MTDKYRRIAYELEAELLTMRKAGRDRLPTESELCARYSCSRQTVRAALALLSDKGLIIRRRGSGSYIADAADAGSSRIALLIEDPDQYIYPDLVNGLTKAFAKKGYELCCYATRGSVERERDILTQLLSECPAALIMEPLSDVIPDHNMPIIESFAKKDIPVVYLFTSYPAPEGSLCITEDDEEGAGRLVRHLRDRGHIHTACLLRCDDSRGLRRYKGYVGSLLEYGLPFEEKRVWFFTGADRRKFLAGNDELMRRFAAELDGRCTAVVCQNDETAYRLIRVLEQNGRTGVTVVSFDNSYYASGEARITSLGHNGRELITEITEAACAAVSHSRFDTVPVRWHLHVRNS